MKNKILYGWNPRRVLYLVLGIAVIVYFVMTKEWWGAAVGAYFALMGLFNFGCAAGNCTYQPRPRQMHPHDEESFDEIKAD